MHGQDVRSQGHIQHSIREQHRLLCFRQLLARACVGRECCLGHEKTATHAQLGFIPKMWQLAFPDIPQIPYTFAPRQLHAAPGKRRGRKGNISNPGSAAGAVPRTFPHRSMSGKSTTGSFGVPRSCLSRHTAFSLSWQYMSLLRMPCILLTTTHDGCCADGSSMALALQGRS